MTAKIGSNMSLMPKEKTMIISVPLVLQTPEIAQQSKLLLEES